MENDITGRLLCPIEYDWDDEPSVSSCDIFLRVPEHFSLVFVMESARGPSTYPKIIFFDVSTLTEQEILIMLRKDFSGVVYLLRFVLLFLFPPCTNIAPCYLIDIF